MRWEREIKEGKRSCAFHIVFGLAILGMSLEAFSLG